MTVPSNTRQCKPASQTRCGKWWLTILKLGTLMWFWPQGIFNLHGFEAQRGMNMKNIVKILLKKITIVAFSTVFLKKVEEGSRDLAHLDDVQGHRGLHARSTMFPASWRMWMPQHDFNLIDVCASSILNFDTVILQVFFVSQAEYRATLLFWLVPSLKHHFSFSCLRLP
jgi:hypothetical protein